MFKKQYDEWYSVTFYKTNSMKKLFILLTFLCFNTLLAQKKLKYVPKDISINEQFNFLLKNSNNYKQFKVINQNWIATVKKNAADTISGLQKGLLKANVTIKDQQKTIDNLNGQLAGVQSNLDTVNSEKENISFLGTPTSKQNYKTIMWTIVGILIAILGFFIFKFKSNQSITKDTLEKLSDLETEFEDHRRRALEREQKVMRKLQDEINKNKK